MSCARIAALRPLRARHRGVRSYSATGITTLADAAVVSAGSDLFKAWWNMALVEEERSLGAHNPGFTQRVLATSKGKALAIPAAP
jgi:hypothetical protein